MQENAIHNVTISFDGLLVFDVDKEFRHVNVGVHTQAAGHKVKVRIESSDSSDHFPDLEFDYTSVRKYGHYWVYVADDNRGYESITNSVSIPTLDQKNPEEYPGKGYLNFREV